MSFLAFLADASEVIKNSAGKACGGAGGSCGNADLNVIFKNVTNTLIFLVGAISVIMIIIGGLRYVTSNGDAKQTEAAKNTIMYSIIGIIVAIAAYAIVNFVADKVG